jgi:MYXO-CTERM domain-containing protein
VPATGQITHVPVTNGTNCDDGDRCNGIATCQTGNCVNGTAVSCSSAPGDCFEPAGTCNPATGACSYPPKAPDAVCNDGQRCTTPDTCDGNGVCNGSTVVCGTRSPTCVDANTSRAYSGGACQSSDGICAYTETDTSCAAGCNQTTGLCNNDPCANVTCNSAPSQCHLSTGQCSGGNCSYSLKPTGADCDDGDACTATDECSAAGECAGTPRVCNTPEPARCLDTDTSRSFNPAGVCEAGECKYATIDAECPMGCNSTTGLCNGDPCIGKNCDQPPSQCHLNIGSCANGTCSYERKTAGATCDDQNACTERDNCSAGGQCAGEPKICNSPPPATCVDGSTSRTFAAAGTCTAATGSCAYTQTDTACPNGCDAASGRCTGDPCASVTCNQPPGACSLDVGDCKSGTCTYGPKPAGVRCDDGDECTTDETCNGDGQCGGGAPVPACGGTGGTPGDAGTDGSVGSAGRGGSSGTGDAGVRPDAGGKGSTGKVAGEDDGCGCRIPGSTRNDSGLWLLAALAGLVALRRRKT